MDKEIESINWAEIMDKFAKHEGSVVGFCRDNNIKQHQLYHQRKKLKKKKTQTFHVIDISKVPDLKNTEIIQQSVKIEIGNAKIFVPVDDKNTLLSLIRELAKL